MKYLFSTIALCLFIAAIGLRASYPDLTANKPVIYWVTDPNPAREQQVTTFSEWMIKHGHVDAEGEPVVELRLDTSNSDDTKKIIQSVSGVAGDLMDTSDPAMRLLQAMGVLAEVTDDAEAMGFGVNQTYPTVADALMIDGRQYRYPANVSSQLWWVNVDTFRRFGVEVPPDRWTWAEFEELGLKFKEAANPPGTRPSERRFISAGLSLQNMIHSAGLSALNETMTASPLDDPRYAEVLRTMYRWIYEINIVPTPDDKDSFASAQGYGGANTQLFGAGQYAMMLGGRHNLIQFRRFSGLGELRVVEPPHNGFPVSDMQTRSVALYTGSDHPELAKLFLAYLASEEYNRQIVADADGLPPNPKFTHSDAYLSPPEYPNEWQAHQAFAEAANTIGVTLPMSPYIQPTQLRRRLDLYQQQAMLSQATPEYAAAATARDINSIISNEVDRKPELRALYERGVKNQLEIERRLAAGEKIPAELITNPFYIAYYRRNGQLIEMVKAPPTVLDEPAGGELGYE